MTTDAFEFTQKLPSVTGGSWPTALIADASTKLPLSMN
jgi:hypothetical protein